MLSARLREALAGLAERIDSGHLASAERLQVAAWSYSAVERTPCLLLDLRPHFGSGTVASLFGARVLHMGDAIPWVEPLHSNDAIRDLVARGLPDVHAGFGARVLEKLLLYRDYLDKYPGIRIFTLRHPRAARHRPAALGLRPLYVAMREDSALVQTLLNVVTETTIAFTHLQKQIAGEPLDQAWHFWYRVAGGVHPRTPASTTNEGCKFTRPNQRLEVFPARGQELLVGALDVLTDRTLRGHRMTLPEGGDDRFMRTHDVPQVLLVLATQDGDEGKQRRRQVIKHASQSGVARLQPDVAMKLQIGLREFEIGVIRDRTVDRFQPPFQLLQFLGADASRRLHSRGLFQQNADDNALLEVLLGELGHDGLFVGHAHDKACLLELQQRLANSRLANSQIVGQPELPQGIAGLKLSLEDSVPDRFFHLVAQAASLKRPQFSTSRRYRQWSKGYRRLERVSRP